MHRLTALFCAALTLACGRTSSGPGGDVAGLELGPLATECQDVLACLEAGRDDCPDDGTASAFARALMGDGDEGLAEAAGAVCFGVPGPIEGCDKDLECFAACVGTSCLECMTGPTASLYVGSSAALACYGVSDRSWCAELRSVCVGE